MTIEITKPELEAMILKRLKSGAFQNAEEVILDALKTSEPKAPVAQKVPEARNLAELFANSPFAGLDMDFERDKDFGREIEL